MVGVGLKQLCVFALENFLGHPPSFYLPTNNSFPETLFVEAWEDQQALGHNTCALVCPSCSSGTGFLSSQLLFPTFRVRTSGGMSEREFKCITVGEKSEKWKLQMSQLYSNTPVLKKVQGRKKTFFQNVNMP